MGGRAKPESWVWGLGTERGAGGLVGVGPGLERCGGGGGLGRGGEGEQGPSLGRCGEEAIQRLPEGREASLPAVGRQVYRVDSPCTAQGPGLGAKASPWSCMSRAGSRPASSWSPMVPVLTVRDGAHSPSGPTTPPQPGQLGGCLAPSRRGHQLVS